VEALLERAASFPGPTRVLLSGAGLAWAGEARLEGLEDVGVCSRHAGEAGWRVETAPAGIRWTSLAVWLIELEEQAPLWVALP